MKTNAYYPLPQYLVSAIRSADILTGEFLRAPLSAAAAEGLRQLDLVRHDLAALTELGMEVRDWLMRGVDEAPGMVAALLERAAWV
jgi:hypothetical protein